MSDPTHAGRGAGIGPIAGAALVGVAVVAAVVAFVMLRTPDPAPEAPVQQAATEPPTVDPGTPDSAAETPETHVAPDLVDAAPILPPSFDLVRVEADGNALIAGQAGAGAEVTLSLDGDPLDRVEADLAGNFVAMLALAPADHPRVLSLEAVLPDGAVLPGEQTVIIAPFAGADPAPEQMAGVAAEPADPAETVTTADLPGDAPRLLPDPPPQLRTDPPGVGEADTAPPAVAVGTDGGMPAGDLVADLPATAADPAPTADTQSPLDPDPVLTAQGPADPVDPGNAVPQTMPETAPALAAQPEAPAVLLADRDGVRVLQPSGGSPEALSTLQLDTISYDLEGEVTLAGRGPADTSVRVTLNNQPINLGEIGPGGQWSLDLPDVDPGTYTLRLEQLAADGTVTGQIETPFLREDPARIQGNPMLVEPGASVITVQRGFTLWGIAEANFGEGILYVQIFQENRAAIRDPDLIFPGQIFALPDLPRSPAGE